MSRESRSQGRAGGRQLTLVRHAKSSWLFDSLDDFRRPLNKRGLRDCLKMPARVARYLTRPDLVLCSDSVRTIQTCEAMADAFELHEDRIVLDNGLYLGSHRDLLKRIRAVSGDPRHVMLVGHNPGISELCNHLVPVPVEELPTLAVAALVLQSGEWADLRRGCARLERLMLPREMLKEAPK